MQITSCPLLSSRRASAVIAFKCPTGAGTVIAIRIVKYYQASISALDVGDLAFVDPGLCAIRDLSWTSMNASSTSIHSRSATLETQ
jgi:hypothetical protein